jgi:hypothetical protein
MTLSGLNSQLEAHCVGIGRRLFSVTVRQTARNAWIAEFPDQHILWESALPFAGLDPAIQSGAEAFIAGLCAEQTQRPMRITLAHCERVRSDLQVSRAETVHMPSIIALSETTGLEQWFPARRSRRSNPSSATTSLKGRGGA